MKIYRYRHNNKTDYGVLKEDRLFKVIGSIYKRFELAENGIPISETTLLPPVVPSKIVAVGRNYKEHADAARFRKSLCFFLNRLRP